MLHVHKSFKDTQRFDAAFQDVKAQITKDGIYKEPSRFVRCPRPTIEPTSRRRRRWRRTDAARALMPQPFWNCGGGPGVGPRKSEQAK